MSKGKGTLKKLLAAAALLLVCQVIPGALAAQELPEGAVESGEGRFVYQTEYFYSGNISEGVAADMQPGETLEVALDACADFTAGTYTLSIRSCGNRESFEILVNGESVGTVTRTGTGFGQDQMTEDKLEDPLELEPGDKVTICAPDDESYGWVDNLKLTDVNAPEEGGDEPAEPAEKTETGEGYFRYQAEAYYTGSIVENVTADLQPDETLTFTLSDNGDFVQGEYTLSVHSCGNRDTFTVLVNGEQAGTISRSGTGFGLDQMTDDKLLTVLTLGPGDELSLVGQSGEYWGWVDYIDLLTGDKTGTKPAEGDPTQSGDGWILYQAEFFYNILTENADAADLKPSTEIEIPLNTSPDFAPGWYTVTVISCGARESIYVRLNGKTIGSVSRLGTGYGADEMTEDRFSTKVELGADDVLTLAAPGDGSAGWVDAVRLNKVDPPAQADTQPTTPEPSNPGSADTEPTSPETPAQEPSSGSGTAAIVIGVAAAVVVVGAVAVVAVRKKKK